MEKSITDLIKELVDAVAKAEIANETKGYDGKSSYNVVEEITKANKLCAEILRITNRK